MIRITEFDQLREDRIYQVTTPQLNRPVVMGFIRGESPKYPFMQHGRKARYGANGVVIYADQEGGNPDAQVAEMMGGEQGSSFLIKEDNAAETLTTHNVSELQAGDPNFSRQALNAHLMMVRFFANAANGMNERDMMGGFGGGFEDEDEDDEMDNNLRLRRNPRR